MSLCLKSGGSRCKSTWFQDNHLQLDSDAKDRDRRIEGSSEKAIFAMVPFTTAALLMSKASLSGTSAYAQLHCRRVVVVRLRNQTVKSSEVVIVLLRYFSVK